MPIALTSDACTQMLAKKTILKGARRDDVPLVVLLSCCLVVLLSCYLNAGVASQKMCGEYYFVHRGWVSQSFGKPIERVDTFGLSLSSSTNMLLKLELGVMLCSIYAR